MLSVPPTRRIAAALPPALVSEDDGAGPQSVVADDASRGQGAGLDRDPPVKVFAPFKVSAPEPTLTRLPPHR